MKTTITINLGGIVFNIDDDAYKILHNYLLAIEKQFIDEQERKEVMADIEYRLSELFTEILGQKRNVIMNEDVSKVISIMGEPDDFVEEPVNNESTNNQNRSYERKSKYNKTTRRLYRDPDNRILGGVCSGMGAYLNIDPIIVRIIFILLAIPGMGSGIVIYLILWIVIPEALTATQKLEMRGEPITIENITKAVRDEFESVRKNMKF
ncbi:MAG TPA: PspC domain-containing protein [Bacteroidales bacterium]|nr:PspC domain-containing protein [Bacteroidales bacterium]